MREDIMIIDQLLPYNDSLDKRNTLSIEMIVLHCTELPTLEMAREYGERLIYEESRTGNSGHYYIDRDGSIFRYVEDDRIAHHVFGFNPGSIGIEIVNNGRYPHWFRSTNQNPTEDYAADQINAVKKLLRFLKGQYPAISTLSRHSDLDTRKIAAEDDPGILIHRKIDPGPLFPWDEVLDEWVKMDRNTV
jgi:N-acetylmuramoyl-L-alanine amidase